MKNLLHNLHLSGYMIIRELLAPSDVYLIKKRLKYLCEHQEYFQSQGAVFIPHQNKEMVSSHPLARFTRIDHLWNDPVCWEKLFAHPHLIKVAKKILGPDFYMNPPIISIKPPEYPAHSPWHRDPAPWGTTSSRVAQDSQPLLFNYWISLDDADENNGCLQLVKESHRKSTLPYRDPDATEQDKSQLPHEQPEELIINCRIAPGDVVIFHQDMLHKNGPNLSAEHRTSAVGSFFSARALTMLDSVMPHNKLRQKARSYVSGQNHFKDKEFPVDAPEDRLAQEQTSRVSPLNRAS